MKSIWSVFAVAGICAVFSANAAADGLVQLVSDEVHYVSQEETDPSPSDVEPEPDLDAEYYGGGGSCCMAGYGGLNVGGWLQMGYHTEGVNQGALGGVHPGGVFWDMPGLALKTPFNNNPNEFQLHQAWVYAEKVAETGGYGWDWGFRFDYVYGTDGQDAQSMGNVPGIWDEPWDNGANYGSAIPQLYGEVAYNNLSVKAGRFFTIIGYEKVQAPQNFFYSHSMSQLMEPYGHTGFLADYDLNGQVTVYAGWTAGWDTGFDQNGGDSFLGGVAVQLTDRMSLTYAAMFGDFGYRTDVGSDSDGYLHSIVLDWDVGCRLNYVLQTDYLDNSLLTVAGSPMLTVNQYLIYDLNDRWAMGGRFEYMSVTAVDQEYYGFTVGANYRPRTNLVIRPEVRVDVINERPGLADSTVFGIDAILTF